MSEPVTNTAKTGLKQRAVHEFKHYIVVSGYLALLFGAVAVYSNLTIQNCGGTEERFTLTFVLIKALVLGKVILLGEMVHLGQNLKRSPIYQRILFKTLLFGLLLIAFHFVEELVRSAVHHEQIMMVIRQTNLSLLGARSIIVLIAMIPLFAFQEIDAALGNSRLRTLLLEQHHSTDTR
jgi:hypothetical protein